MNKLFFTTLLVFLFDISLAQLNNPIEPTDMPWIDYTNPSRQEVGSDLLQVNPNTGIGNINIGLYKYSLCGVDMSVSINYNTRGILVDRIASAVGIGWELYAGGYIYRQQRGSLPDELNVSATNGGSTTTVTGFWATTPSSISANSDDEPDLFIASIGGKTLQFMFSRSGNLITIPENFNNYTIKRFINGVSADPQTVVSNGDLSFQITDDLGNTFFFDKKKYYQLGNVNFGATSCIPSLIDVITEWKLTKVQTLEGQQVLFSYSLDDYYDGTFPTYNEVDCLSQSVVEDIAPSAVSHESYVQKLYYNYHLSKISYPNNIDVNLNYASYTNGLNSLDVTERVVPASSTPVSYSYVFNRETWDPANLTDVIDASYYPSHPTSILAADAYPLYPVGISGSRNALRSLDLIGTTGIDTRRYYTFSYNTVPLHQADWGGKDLYGFSNGQIPTTTPSQGLSTYTYVPIHTHASASIGMDRSISADVNVIAACSLTGVTNSMSGTISWQYMVNPLNVGGLLISSINYFDGYSHDNDINKIYAYSNGENFVSEGAGTYQYRDNGCVDHTVWFNSGNILNADLNGYSYGFDNAIVTSKDNVGNIINVNKYYYSGLNLSSSISGISSNLLSNGISFGQIPYSNKQYLSPWGIGLLLKDEKYDNNNQLLQSNEYSYIASTISNTGTDFTGTSRYQIDDCASDVGAIHIIVDNYQPFTGYTRLSGKLTKDWYSSTSYITNNETYGYFNDLTLSSHKRYNDIGNTLYEFYLYNKDWLPTGSPNPGTAVNAMNTYGLKKMITVYKYKDISTNPSTAYINDATNNLMQLDASGWVNIGSAYPIIRKKYNYSFYTSFPPVTYLSAAPDVFYVDMSDLSVGNPVPYAKLESIVSQYDDVGNEIELQPNPSGSVYNSQIIDEETGAILAEAQNAQHNEIAYCGFESDYRWPNPYVLSNFMSGNWNFNPNAITNNHYLLGRYSFHCSSSAGTTLNSTGSLQIGKKYTVSFWCLGTGSQPVFVNDGGSTTVYTPVAATYTVTATGEVWTLYKGIFTAAGLAIGMWGEGFVDEIKIYPSDCLMRTHNFLPLIGKTSDVDENDNITSYEYDPFGSLSIIRDQNGNIRSKNILSIQH